LAEVTKLFLTHGATSYNMDHSTISYCTHSYW